jgi:hypothetical protein
MLNWTLGCDANDPHRLADFWAQTLGCTRELGYDNPDSASAIDRSMATDDRSAIGRLPELGSTGFRLAVSPPSWDRPRLGCASPMIGARRYNRSRRQSRRSAATASTQIPRRVGRPRTCFYLPI